MERSHLSSSVSINFSWLLFLLRVLAYTITREKIERVPLEGRRGEWGQMAMWEGTVQLLSGIGIRSMEGLCGPPRETTVRTNQHRSRHEPMSRVTLKSRKGSRLGSGSFSSGKVNA